MKLIHTQKLMENKLKEVFFDSYAVRVGIDGHASFISSANVNMDTYFDIASMGKVLVTSTLLLNAAGEGKLTLEDTLDMYFDFVPDEKKKITVKQLLTHTSGIVRKEIPRSITALGRDAIAMQILSVPLAFHPGTDYLYSCTGYILLGFILEKLYGMKLDDIFDKNLKPRLGLTRSRFNIPENEVNAVICHYRKEAGSCMCADSIVYNMDGIAGNGASFWTVADISRFITAVFKRDEKLYPRRYFDLAEGNLTPDFSEGRGLGYLVTDDSYKQTGKLFPTGSFGHCGNTGTSFFINRKLNLSVIIMTNATRYSYIRHDYKTCDYSETMKMREEIHNSILADLIEQELL